MATTMVNAGAEPDDAHDAEEALIEEGEIAGDYLEQLLDVLDFDGDIDLDVEGDRAVVSIDGGRDLSKLVGRGGEVLDALQELTRLAVQQSTGVRSRLMLDVAGWRAKRREELSALGTAARWTVTIARWPVLGISLVLGLAVLYRVGPDRADARWRWVSPGAILAAVIWLLASVGFSIYSSAFGSYNETYGTLAGVVVTMLWLQISAAAILLGAELNAELERQTGEDTTAGPPEPIGERGAVAADTVGPSTKEMAETFLECIIAPDFTEEALQTLSVKKGLRLLKGEIGTGEVTELEMRSVAGGLLIQTRDAETTAGAAGRVVTRRAPYQRVL